jgi:hypothetical protein
MKKNVFTAFAVALSVLVFSWSGCDNNNGPDTEEFIIQIDSIVHADTITLGETLSIKFYGRVGPNGCYAFDRLVPEYMQIDASTGELATTAFGIQTFQDLCPDQEVYLNGSELVVSDIPAGNLIVKALQPDGSAITQQVFVKE